MRDQLLNIKNTALSLILDAEDEDALESVMLQFLGRSGQLTVAMKGIKDVDPAKRPEMGQLINEIKSTLEDAINEKRAGLKQETIKKKKQTLDTTMPGNPP